MSESSDSESPVKQPPPRPKQQQPPPRPKQQQQQQQKSPAKPDTQQPALKPTKQQPFPAKSASETVDAAAAAGAKLTKEARDALVQKLIQAKPHSIPPASPRTHIFAGQTQARSSRCTALAAARRPWPRYARGAGQEQRA